MARTSGIHAFGEPVGRLPDLWRPVGELTERDRHGDSAGFLLCAPELVDLDCNVHGVGPGYWQDGPVSAGGAEHEDGTWLAAKWNMTNDEWDEVPCTPTHFLRLEGPPR